MRNVLLSLCLAVPLVGVGVVVGDLGGRLAQLECAPRADPAMVSAIDRELEQLSRQVDASILAIGSLSREQGKTVELDQRLSDLKCELEDASRDIDAQRARIAQWDSIQDQIGPKAVDARFAQLRTRVEDRWKALDELANRALGSAESAHESVEELSRNVHRDPQGMWHDLLGPTVQLMGEETVGTGVLLASEPVAGTEEFVTYVLTAWHVIRDIQSTPQSTSTPVPVTIYSSDGSLRSETAQLIRYDATLDVALLKLNSTRAVESGAKLAPREHLGDVRIFERIYAVGCPLGNDPIPTFGEIADTHHQVDGQHYWMISAPTYIGNSGGGIFDADTHELLGIFTKIYTHGTLRPTVVPHMGLATPLPAIYDWLEDVGYASLEPGANGTAKTASAHR